MKMNLSIRSITLIFISLLIISCGGDDTHTLNLTDLNITLDQDTTTEIDLNPTHPSGASFEYQIVTQPRYGELSLGSDQRHWVYTPFRNYVGDDTFEFSATNGADVQTATATLTVTEVFIPGRPMSVTFYELTSPVDGQLDATWYNSFDVDGTQETLQYHVYLSTDADFYPSDATRIKTLTGTLNTSITGLVEGETYYIAVLAEDTDGKFSKDIDKQAITLTTTLVEFQGNDTVYFARDLPITSITLGETEVILETSSQLQDLSGKVLQLDETNDYGFVVLESAINITPTQHRYSFRFADPQDFLKSLAFSTNKGDYNPEQALLNYYRNAAEQPSVGAAYIPAQAAFVDLTGAELERLLVWANLSSIDELYEDFLQTFDINLNAEKEGRLECGSFSPEFEPLNNSWQPSPLEFTFTLNFKCSVGYALQVRWDDVARSEPEILRAELTGAITTSLSTSGALRGTFLNGAVNLPRKRQLVIGRYLRLGPIPIPLTIALNAKGTLVGTGYGEITADFNTKVETGVNYGAQYTAANGFSAVGKGLYSKIVPTSGSLNAVDISTKVGVQIASSVGPEIILSLVNIKPAYRIGKDGVASMATHIGPQIGVKMETSPNPAVAVDNLNATLFGISAYEWAVNLTSQNRLSLHVPTLKEFHHDAEIISVPLLHLPDFELSYNELPGSSNEFELHAVPSDYWTWNDADVIPSKTLWHAIPSNDAVLQHDSSHPLYAKGKWTGGDSTSVFVLEYQPDTLSTLVANLTELTQGMAKQYATLDGYATRVQLSSIETDDPYLIQCIDQMISAGLVYADEVRIITSVSYSQEASQGVCSNPSIAIKDTETLKLFPNLEAVSVTYSTKDYPKGTAIQLDLSSYPKLWNIVISGNYDDLYDLTSEEAIDLKSKIIHGSYEDFQQNKDILKQQVQINISGVETPLYITIKDLNIASLDLKPKTLYTWPSNNLSTLRLERSAVATLQTQYISSLYARHSTIDNLDYNDCSLTQIEMFLVSTPTILNAASCQDLNKLDIGGGDIQDVVLNNPALSYLFLSGLPIKNIDLGGAPSLKKLYLAGLLTEVIDLSGNYNLKTFYNCESHITDSGYITIVNMRLKTLVAPRSTCVELNSIDSDDLYIDAPQLETLILENPPESPRGIHTLDLRHLDNLKGVIIRNTPVDSLELPEQLEGLSLYNRYVSYGQIETINLSHLKKLRYFKIDSPTLRSVYLYDMPVLENIEITSDLLHTLNIRNSLYVRAKIYGPLSLSGLSVYVNGTYQGSSKIFITSYCGYVGRGEDISNLIVGDYESFPVFCLYN